MLRQLLAHFHNAPGPLSVELLAAQLDLEVGVLQGMLNELVRLGRLVRVEERGGAACAACGLKNGCPYVLATGSAYYALPELVTANAACASSPSIGRTS